jgi:DNA primase
MNAKQLKESIRIKDFLAYNGYKPIKDNGIDLFYLSPLRIEKTASFKVNDNLNFWFDFGLATGGNIIDLVCKMKNTDFKGAIKLLNENYFSISQATTTFAIEKKNDTSGHSKRKDTIQSVKDITNENLIRYIKSRNINIDIAKKFCNEVHYSHNEKNYYAVGFKNNLGGFELRTKIFDYEVKRCLGSKYFTLIKAEIMNPGILFIFEGFFDFLSWLTINRTIKAPQSLILNSTVNIDKATDIIKNSESVILFLDNDETGREAVKKIKALNTVCEDKSFIYSEYKDLNGFLMKK